MSWFAPPTAGMVLPKWLKESFIEMKKSELAYLDGLPAMMRLKLAGNLAAWEKEKQNYRHYGEVAFVFAGLKPCVLIQHSTAGPLFAQGLVRAVVAPVFKKHGLAEQGFQLVEIKHELKTLDPKHPGFTGGWLVVNTRHERHALVAETFLDPARRRVDEAAIGAALGYPAEAGPASVCYLDATEAEEAKLARVPVLSYSCPAEGDDKQYKALYEHYMEYGRVYVALGRKLTFDQEQHPRLKDWLEGIRAGRIRPPQG